MVTFVSPFIFQPFHPYVLCYQSLTHGNVTWCCVLHNCVTNPLQVSPLITCDRYLPHESSHVYARIPSECDQANTIPTTMSCYLSSFWRLVILWTSSTLLSSPRDLDNSKFEDFVRDNLWQTLPNQARAGKVGNTKKKSF